METTNQPYELLLRWGQDGKLSGAHVQRRYIIRDNGIVVGESVGQAEPLGLNDFPLQDILADAQADALAENVAVKARVDELEPLVGELEHVKGQLDALTAAHNTALDDRRKVDDRLVTTAARLNATEQINAGLSEENLRLRTELKAALAKTDEVTE